MYTFKRSHGCVLARGHPCGIVGNSSTATEENGIIASEDGILHGLRGAHGEVTFGFCLFLYFFYYLFTCIVWHCHTGVWGLATEG